MKREIFSLKMKVVIFTFSFMSVIGCILWHYQDTLVWTLNTLLPVREEKVREKPMSVPTRIEIKQHIDDVPLVKKTVIPHKDVIIHHHKNHFTVLCHHLLYQGNALCRR